MGRHNPRIAQPGQCPACGVKFAPDDVVIRTTGGSITCASHRWMFVHENVAFTGPYREVRKS